MFFAALRNNLRRKILTKVGVATVFFPVMIYSSFYSDSTKRHQQDEYIPCRDWFEDIVGCPEKLFRELKKQSIKIDRQQHLEVHNIKTHDITKAGKFSLESIDKLTETVEGGHHQHENGSSSSSNNNRVTLHIIQADQLSKKFVNVAYLQSLPENRNSVFQVASNFNGIEAISENSIPTSPTFTTDYIYDYTQGPVASISAGGAAITRVHAAFFGEDKDQSEWAQTDTRQVNFLSNLQHYFPVANGYVVLNPSTPPLPNDIQELNKLLQRGCIGYHKDVQVTFGETSAGRIRKVNNPNQIIDQVFCAGLNVGQGSSGYQNLISPGIGKKMKFILNIAYEGTYLTAIANKRKKLFLTFIGGGVFGNSQQLILEAILDAHKKWALHKNSTLEEVVLVVYSGNIPSSFENELVSNNLPYKITFHQNSKL